jgi:hypothetical protein
MHLNEKDSRRNFFRTLVIAGGALAAPCIARDDLSKRCHPAFGAMHGAMGS